MTETGMIDAGRCPRCESTECSCPPEPLPGQDQGDASGAGAAVRGPGAGWTVWAALLGALTAVAAVVAWADRLPAPLPADAPAAAFSEARAAPVLHHLADTIGDRGIGTAGRDAALAYLAGVLAGIPGIEVAVQEETVVGSFIFQPGVVDWYHARNLLVRIPGESPDAVLFSTHYDSPGESVGAGDAAMIVAAGVETIRALAAAGERPRNTLLFHFSDGEEDGLLGSTAFLRHPWAEDVHAFVNVESAGPGGKALLFQTGPGNPWLARAYARAVPRPYGSVLGQDLFQSGIVPSDTDFRVYRDGGLRGLDLATVRDGYAYHTALDRPERIPAGTVQHVGTTMLALARDLGAADLPGDVGGRSAVYYSVLSRGMLVYGAGTGLLLAAGALLLALVAVGVAVRRRRLALRHAATGFAVSLLAWVAGIALAVLAALVVSVLAGRPGGWYATPALGVVAFGSLALAGAAGIHALWARLDAQRGRPAPDRPLAAWVGGLLLWSLVLAAFAAGGLGSAYLALWWVLPAAAAVLLAVRFPGRSTLWYVAALVPGALLTIEAARLLIGFFIPMTGRMGEPMHLDGPIAVLVALPVLAVATLALPVAHRGGRLGTAALLFAVLGLAGTARLATAAPYTEERPRRVTVVQTDAPDGTSRLAVFAGNAGDLAPALAGVPLALNSAPGSGGRVYEGEVDPSALPFPAVEVAETGADPAGETRTVRLRIAGGDFRRLVLTIPADRLEGWSLSEALPPLRPGAANRTLRVFPGQGEPWEASFRLRGNDPVEVRLSAVYQPLSSGTPAEVEARLPPWVTSESRTVVSRNLDL
jgi:hypothetical protein